jgi:Ser/Thr protein kinase RdoA (MazF antagonist)
VYEVFDFGLANRTTPAFDVAVAIERNAIGWLSLLQGRRAAVHVHHVDELLSGYEEMRSLAPEERIAVARLAPVAHVDFALSELGYFRDVVLDPGSARLAWESYLMGHLRWWASPAGRRLLRHLERWAGG